MRMLARTLGPLVLCVSLSTCGGPNKASSDGGGPKKTTNAKAGPQKTAPAMEPQAQAALNWIGSGKSGDMNAFKAAWSTQYRKQYEAEGWDKVFARFKGNWEKIFGDYKSGDFEFEFDNAAGALKVTFRGKTLEPDLKLKNEGGAWRISSID